MDDEERTLLGAWEPEVPPARFAEEVVAATRGSGDPQAVTRSRRAVALLVLPLVAGVLAWGTVRPDLARGDLTATTRAEIRLGTRALAVVEPGAHLTWHGSDVDQSVGEVFYRVEPGVAFRVHTPAGEVTVRGTCFDVAVRSGNAGQAERETTMTKGELVSAGAGMVVGAMVFVGVHEGKVALSHASASVDLTAGQGARADDQGIHGPERASVARDAWDGDPAAGAGDPAMVANANLANAVRDYKRRLEALDAQKKKTEARLKLAERKIASANGETHDKKYPLKLDADDWKTMAPKGEVRYLIPMGPPGAKELAGFGLSPGEEAVLLAAHEASYARTLSIVEPICEAAVGSAALAAKLGVGGCVLVVMGAEGDVPLGNALREVGKINAGLMPMPADVGDPAEQLFLALTRASGLFEADLSASLGPDEAARLTYQDDTAMLGQHWFPDD